MLNNILPRRKPKQEPHFVALCVCGNPNFAYLLYRDLLKFGIEMRHVWADHFDKLPIDKRQGPTDIDFGFVIKDNILSRGQREAAQFKIEKVSRALFFEVQPNNRLISELLVHRGFYGKPLDGEQFKAAFGPEPGELAKDLGVPTDTGVPKAAPVEPPTESTAVQPTAAEPVLEEDIPPDLRRLSREERASLAEAGRKMREARAAMPGVTGRQLGRLIDPKTQGTIAAQLERTTMVPSNTMCEALEIVYRLPPGTIPRLGRKDYSHRLAIPEVKKRAEQFFQALDAGQELPTFDVPEPAPVVIAQQGDYYHHPLLVEPYRAKFAPIAAPTDFEPTMSVTSGMKALSLDERRRLFEVGRGLAKIRIGELKLSLQQFWCIIQPDKDNKSSLSQMENGSHRFGAPTTAALEMLYGVPAGTIASGTNENMAYPFDLEGVRLQIAKWQIEHGFAKAAPIRDPIVTSTSATFPAPKPEPKPAPAPVVTLPQALAISAAGAPVNDNSPQAVKSYFPNPPAVGSSRREYREFFSVVLGRLQDYMAQAEYAGIEMNRSDIYYRGADPAALGKTG